MNSTQEGWLTFCDTHFFSTPKSPETHFFIMNPEVVNYMVGVEAAQDANYTFVEAIAMALDETVQKIEDWRKKAEEEGFDFVETSLQAVQGTAMAVVHGIVDFSLIQYMDSCETGTIAYANVEKDEEGNIISQENPYFQEHDEPKKGNGLLFNLRKIRDLLNEQQTAHEERGMEWGSPHGCPEDGRNAFDQRARLIQHIEKILQKIEGNRGHFS